MTPSRASSSSFGGGGTVTFAMNDSMSDNMVAFDSSVSKMRSANGVGGVSTNSPGPKFFNQSVKGGALIVVGKECLTAQLRLSEKKV